MMPKVLLSLLWLILQTQSAENVTSLVVFRLILSVAERLSSVIDIKSIIEDINNLTGNVEKDMRDALEFLQKGQNEIKGMLQDLATLVDFQSYLNEIGKAQTVISSVSEDFEEFQESSEIDKNNKRSIYIVSYEQNTVDTYIRNLRDRAIGKAIFSLDAMPVLLSRKLKCNMTAIRVFQKGYLSLMINGYGLKEIYINFTGKVTEKHVNDWIAEMNSSVSGLLTVDQTCMDNYREYALRDFEEIHSVQTLHKTVQEKYTWLEVFIVSYSKRGYQYNAIYAAYLRIQSVILNESKQKVMVFCEKKGKESAWDETKTKIIRQISKYQNARTEEADNEAAKHIMNSILETTGSIGSNPYAIIIFADHPEFPVKDIVTGHCANDLSFEIVYGTVKENSGWVWEQQTYNNVKYHVHIFLPTNVIDQPINDSSTNNSYKIDISASYRERASMPLLIVLALFMFFNLETW